MIKVGTVFLFLVIYAGFGQGVAEDSRQQLHFADSSFQFSQQVQLAALLKSDPVNDVKHAVTTKDFRFIAVMGFCLSCPGLKGIHHQTILDHGHKALTGGTDDIYNELVGELVVALNEYATSYNQILFKSLSPTQQKELLEYVPPAPKDPFEEFGR